MSTANDTVRGRVGRARTELTPPQVAAGIALVAALGFALLVVQEPAVHDSVHDFRHAAGMPCH